MSDRTSAAQEKSKEGARLELAAVVLNYRTPEMVIACLESVVPQMDPACARVVVVDNASGDDSVEQIERAIADRGWSRQVELVASPENRGFSAGNNLGIRSANAENYLLLNSDTVLRAGALVQLLPGSGQGRIRQGWVPER